MVGRNDPCPCGSGKKYKKCCLLKNQGRFFISSEYLSATNSLQRKLARYSVTEFDPAEEQKALDIFTSCLGEEWTKDPKIQIFFNEWLVYDYLMSDNKKIIDEFFKKNRPSLTEIEIELLNSWRDCHLSLYEVEEVVKGQGIILRDIFTKEIFNVKDVSSSNQLVKWDIMFTRVIKVGKGYTMVAVAFLIPPNYKEDIINLVNEEFQKYKRKKEVKSLQEFLAVYGFIILRYIKETAGKLPSMHTPEGDEILMSKAVYKINDFEPVVKKLQELNDFDLSDEKVLQNGNKQYQFTWLEKGSSQNLIPKIGPVQSGMTLKSERISQDSEIRGRILGDVVVTSDKLTIETISGRRLKFARERVEKEVGQYLLHKGDYYETMDVALKKSKKPDEEKIPEEIKQKILGQTMGKYYSQWADETIPALSYFSPREACFCEYGQKKLIELWKYMENIEARKKDKSGQSISVAELKKRVELAKSELEDFISGRNKDNILSELKISNEIPLMKDFHSFIDYITKNKIVLTEVKRYLPKKHIEKINDLFIVKDIKPRTYMFDYIARELGLINANKKIVPDIKVIETFFKLSPQMRLWQMFYTWWYKVDWMKTVRLDYENAISLWNTLTKRQFRKTILKCETNKKQDYKKFTDELIREAGFEIEDAHQGEDPLTVFPMLIEHTYLMALAWFEIVHLEHKPYTEMPVPVRVSSTVKKLQSFVLTESGKVLIHNLFDKGGI